MVVEALPTDQRRISPTRGLLADRKDAGEFLIHALAQLPDNVVLDFPDDLRERKSLGTLATAYGIGDRVSFLGDPSPARSNSSHLLERRLRERRPMGEVVEYLTQGSDLAASIRLEDEIFAGQRIVVVTNLPTHYRVPLFARMATRLSAAGAAFRVLFLAQPPKSRPWMTAGEISFDHEFVRGVDVGRDRGRRVLPLGLQSRLHGFGPTLILSGGFSPAVSGRLALIARRSATPFGIWSGELGSRSTAQSRLRAFERRWVARRASFAVAYGSPSAEYLKTLRPDLPIVLGRNTTLPAPSRRTTGALTVDVLTVGRAEAGKSLELAIDAVRKTSGCRLSIIGGGSRLSELERHAAGDPRIRFLGARPPEETRRAYAEADIFLFPSRYDVFGLVLVEAMSAGLASIVSFLPGAVKDLCVTEVNSLILDNGDSASWAAALARLVEDRDLRESLGDSARRTIENRWTVEHAADAMLAGLRLGILQSRREQI